jgi:hypothetical protein
LTALFLFEDRDRKSRAIPRHEIDQVADEMEIRVYFRYLSGAYTRLRDEHFMDDWKETPILDSLTIEYEKDGAVVRHEELPF